MPSPSDHLNIEDHTVGLIIKALNKTPKPGEAAKMLGISVKTLYHMIEKYKIKAVWKQG